MIEECSICRDTFGVLIKNSIYIPNCECNIYYHKECLDSWYEYNSTNNIISCPVCRITNIHSDISHVDSILFKTLMLLLMSSPIVMFFSHTSCGIFQIIHCVIVLCYSLHYVIYFTNLIHEIKRFLMTLIYFSSGLMSYEKYDRLIETFYRVFDE